MSVSACERLHLYGMISGAPVQFNHSWDDCGPAICWCSGEKLCLLVDSWNNFLFFFFTKLGKIVPRSHRGPAICRCSGEKLCLFDFLFTNLGKMCAQKSWSISLFILKKHNVLLRIYVCYVCYQPLRRPRPPCVCS